MLTPTIRLAGSQETVYQLKASMKITEECYMTVETHVLKLLNWKWHQANSMALMIAREMQIVRKP